MSGPAASGRPAPAPPRLVSHQQEVIRRQRLTPRIWHFSFPMLKNNLQTFGVFAGEVVRLAAGRPALRVLDVGCGNKPWRERLFEAMSPGAPLQYVGTDFSTIEATPDALSLGDHLPFPDDTFDALILSEVVEHCPRPRDVIAECRRVLRPGGLLFASTPFVFYEHGIPHDFQRPTRYFYRDVFSADEILRLNPSNSTYATAVTAVNLAVETTPLRRIPALPAMLYSITNSLALLADALVGLLGPMFTRSCADIFYTMPLGYALVVRIQKPRP